MANLLQSSQTQATTAPDYYNTYLSNLATQGQADVNNAQYVGAQPLQTQAFTDLTNFDPSTANYTTAVTNAGTNLQNAATSTSPLSAASSYLTSAQTDPSTAAASYMANPQLKSALQDMSDVAQTNFQQNLAPQATAGAVGSGQFGSQRGAQALGQTYANAQQALESQQAQLENTAYQNSLNAAIAQNQIANQSGATAGNLAGTEPTNLANIGNLQGTLGTTQQNLDLNYLKSLSTLGQQQQTIAQNQQLFPLTNLSTLAGILRGYNVPTSTTTTANMSPLSAIGALGSTAAAVANSPTLSGALSSAASKLGNLFNSSSSTVDTGLNNTSSGTTDYSGSNTGTGTPFQTVYDSSGNAIGSYDANGNFVSGSTSGGTQST